VPDGPFPWGDEIEALINLIVAVGAMLGTLLTLLVYDYLNGRCVYAACLAFAGFLNILTPAFAEAGGFYTVVIFRQTNVHHVLHAKMRYGGHLNENSLITVSIFFQYK
jgi:hypothetical protein